MGSYTYKVTGKKVKLSNGEVANVAKFAYKPYRSWNDYKLNNKMHHESGAAYCDKAAADGKRSNWVVAPDAVLHFPRAVGSFEDDYAHEKYQVNNVHVL